MSESNNPLRVSTIERMIDGELDTETRRKLLLKAEETPGGWRQIAVAFLEAQQFKSAVTHYLSSAASQARVVESETSRVKRSSVVIPWMIVASLLIVIGGISNWNNSDVVPEQIVNQPDTSLQNGDLVQAPIHEVKKPITVKTQPAFFTMTTYQQPETIKLKFKHPITGEIFEQEVLVIDADNPPSLFTEWISQNEGELQFPAEIQDRLKEQGITAKINRTFHLLPLENGRQAIIPIDTEFVNYTHNKHLLF